MTQKEVLDELKGLVVERLKFDPRRAAEMTLETTLPKGVDGSLGLDSLDFIELSVALEERFGIVIDEGRDLTDEFLSLDSLSKFILATRPANNSRCSTAWASRGFRWACRTSILRCSGSSIDINPMK